MPVSPSRPLYDKRICLDPGHPSEVGLGAQNGKLVEVTIAWQVALRLRDLLTADGAQVAMTKSREREFVSNRRRAEIANHFRADLLLRLHCDSAPGVSGIATYYPDREGVAADCHRGPAAAILAASRRLGVPFHAALVRSLDGALANRGLLTDRQTAVGGKQGALTGSIYAELPVLLVEMCVLDSPHDAAFVRDSKGVEQLAAGLRAAVADALRIR